MIVRCEKHPKYKGKRLPSRKVPCEDCLRLHSMLHSSPRAVVKATKVFKNKSKYDRKNKDWKKE